MITRQLHEESPRAIRALRVASAGKKAVIRTEDESHLYQNICEAITDKGGYALAWIGLPETDARKSVRIVASAGPGTGYLNGLEVSWAEGPVGNGPVGMCLRSGQMTVVNDTAIDPQFLPWRERAARFNLRSTIALPIGCEGKLIGALMIYADDSDAFYCDEMCLLEELAEDLSYGLELRAARESQVRAEKAILQAAAEFRAIFDSTQDAIFIAGFEGSFLEVNEAACRTLGYSRKELLKMKIEDVDAPESAALLPGRLAIIRERGQACFESVQLRRDGTPVPVELNVRAITYHEIPAVLGVAREIGERKKSEAELKAHTAEMARLKVEAENANRAKSVFLANMSHEIRTPLTGILGFTHLLSEGNLNPEQREYNEAVRSSAEHLLELINDLLDFSRIEAGRLDLEIMDFSPRECIELAVSPLRPLAEAKGLAIFVEVSDDVPNYSQADPHRIRQILINLIGNAVKFTEQGSITVRVAVAANSGATPGASSYLQFSVIDTGMGIPEAQWALIFEPFRQADGSITRRFGGTGLGLSICNKLVAQMSGRIWLDAHEGSGSTFCFTIPLIAADAHASGDHSPSGAEPAPKLRLSILVGEDNKLNQRLICRLLEQRGHRPTICSTGKSVLDACRSDEFDLILMDVQMPDMDGLEATRRIRAREASTRSHIPIIAMTAFAMAGDRDRCMEAGFDAYLTKPIDVRGLEHLLAEYTAREAIVSA